MVDLPESLRTLGRREHPESDDLGVAVLVRRLEESDRPWLIDLCKRRYPPYYDTVTAENWISHAVVRNPIQFYITRTPNAFQITNLTASAWTPKEFTADIVAVCCDHGKMWEIFPLLRDSIRWARDRNALRWRFETDTEYDLGLIMRRLGASEITPRYCLNLKVRD